VLEPLPGGLELGSTRWKPPVLPADLSVHLQAIELQFVPRRGFQRRCMNAHSRVVANSPPPRRRTAASHAHSMAVLSDTVASLFLAKRITTVSISKALVHV
jgi:hypothetical protein